MNVFQGNKKRGKTTRCIKIFFKKKFSNKNKQPYLCCVCISLHQDYSVNDILRRVCKQQAAIL